MPLKYIHCSTFKIAWKQCERFGKAARIVCSIFVWECLLLLFVPLKNKHDVSVMGTDWKRTLIEHASRWLFNTYIKLTLVCIVTASNYLLKFLVDVFALSPFVKKNIEPTTGIHFSWIDSAGFVAVCSGFDKVADVKHFLVFWKKKISTSFWKCRMNPEPLRKSSVNQLLDIFNPSKYRTKNEIYLIKFRLSQILQ